MTTTTKVELETAAADLDALIRDETVRERHIRLVRVRSSIERALDILISPETDHSA